MRWAHWSVPCVLALSLACGGGATITEVPGWKSVILAVGIDGPYHVVDASTGEARAWSPTAVPSPAGMQGEPHAFVYRRLLTLSGKLYKQSLGEHTPPQVLSADGRLAYTPVAGKSTELFVVPLGGAGPKKIASPGDAPAWLADGRLCFTDRATLFDAAANLLCVDPSTDAAPTVVYAHPTASIKTVTWHPSGAVAFADEDGAVWVGLPGSAPAVVANPAPRKTAAPLTWSPDASKLVVPFQDEQRRRGLGLWEVGGAWREIVPPHDKLGAVVWRPDGQAIAMTIGENCTRNHRTKLDECDRDVHVFDLATGALRRLTNERWRYEPELGWVDRPG